MLNTKKAPALAIMGREGTSAGASKGVWENSISSSVFWEPHPLGKSYQKATRQGGDYGAACENMYPCDTAGGLTHGRGWGMLKVPKNVRGVAIAVSSSPTMKKVLPAYSACLAAGVFIGRLVHIGGIITSGTREGPAVSNGLGSVVISPLLFNPKLSEVPHD